MCQEKQYNMLNSFAVFVASTLLFGARHSSNFAKKKIYKHSPDHHMNSSSFAEKA